MAVMNQNRQPVPGLILVTPKGVDLDEFTPILTQVLAAAAPATADLASPVASVIIATGDNEGSRAQAAKTFVPIIQQAGTVALVINDTQLAGRAGANGIHCTAGITELRATIDRFQQDRVIGAGNLNSRHAAMEAAEADPDYLYFGKIGTDTFAEPHHRAIDLATWSAEMLTVPVVMQAGGELNSVAGAKDTGADYIALCRALWDHPAGALSAIRQVLDDMLPAAASARTDR